MFTTTDAEPGFQMACDARPAEPRSPRFPAGPRLWLDPCPPDGPGRAAAEAFVRRAYHRAHGARIATFFPDLVLARDDDGAPNGVAGWRGAGTAALFLERYLEGPIEPMISTRFRVAVRRTQIAEVGNFASTGVPAARRLMDALPAFLQERGFVWIAFTATSLLRTLLHDIGASFATLAPARYRPLPGDADDWGRYYAHDPQVIVGHLPSFRPRAAAGGRRA